MANYRYVEVRFDTPVPMAQCNWLLAMLRCVDRDFELSVQPWGFEGLWRSPLISFLGLVNTLHILGFHCRGRCLEQATKGLFDNDCDETLEDRVRHMQNVTPWIVSDAFLPAKDIPWISHTLYHHTRRIQPYLPNPRGGKILLKKGKVIVDRFLSVIRLFVMNQPDPHDMTREVIQEIVEKFIDTAVAPTKTNKQRLVRALLRIAIKLQVDAGHAPDTIVPLSIRALSDH